MLAILAVWVIAMGLCYQVAELRRAAVAGLRGRRTATSSTGSPGSPPQLPVNFGFVVDALTACLLIVVTTIGLLVHVYSIGYMSHDPGHWRFFAYLNLFMFSMLLLVLAEQLPAGLRGLGAGRPVELPAHRVLVPQAHRRRWRPRRRSSSTASATSASRSGSWPIFVNTGTLNIRDHRRPADRLLDAATRSRSR